MPEVGAVFVLQHCRGPSIAPELMIPDAAESGYCCGIRSERRLCEEVPVWNDDAWAYATPVGARPGLSSRADARLDDRGISARSKAW